MHDQQQPALCPNIDALVLFAEAPEPQSEQNLLAKHIEHCLECENAVAALTMPVPLPAPKAATGPIGSRYQLERVISQGGMGVLCTAQDMLLGRQVAIKMIGRDLAGDALLEEAAAQAAFSHPNIVSVLDAGEDEDNAFIVLELAEGVDAHSLSLSSTLTPKSIRTIVSDVASGLVTLHKEGTIHGDISPRNILVAPNGQAKVADFGLASRTPHCRGGTPGFSAPECAGGEITFKSDQYSLGRTLEFLLAHSSAWPQGNRVVRRACSDAPGDRFPDMQSMKDALRSSRRIKAKILVGVTAALLLFFLFLGNERADDLDSKRMSHWNELTQEALRHGRYQQAQEYADEATLATRVASDELQLRSKMLSLDVAMQVAPEHSHALATQVAKLAMQVTDPRLRAKGLAYLALNEGTHNNTAMVIADLAASGDSQLPLAVAASALARIDTTEPMPTNGLQPEVRELLVGVQAMGNNSSQSTPQCDSITAPLPHGLCLSIAAAIAMDAGSSDALLRANEALAALEPVLDEADCDLQLALTIRGIAQLASAPKAAVQDLRRAYRLCPNDDEDERAFVRLQYASALLAVGNTKAARDIVAPLRSRDLAPQDVDLLEALRSKLSSMP